PDELWRNVVPENILRPDAIALQSYREIQVNELPEEQIIIEEEEEFDQQDVLDCPICHISLHQGGDHILQIMRRNRDQRLNLERARIRMEERQRDMDNIPQIREDVDVIDNVQQIVVVKQPPPLQQNEDRNMDPQDFTRCSICNTPLREAMNGNPEVVRLCNNQRHMAHMHCTIRWYDRDGVDTHCVICGLNLILPYVRVNRNQVLQYDTERQNRRLNIERRGKERMELAVQRRQERIAAAKQRDLHNIPQLDRDRKINLDDNQNRWQGRLRVVDMFGNVIRRVIN
ncbi:6145_t:CDS:2, partial [Dentiscutata erythropus]